MIEQFSTDVDLGLSSHPKTLPSKYFYNKKGDALFVEIMKLPEYYLTRAELDTFQNKTDQLIDAFKINKNSYFELIELGSGDGLKTKSLLQHLDEQKYKFDYFPIDISVNALNLLQQNLKLELPDVSVQTKQGDYFEVLSQFKNNKYPKVVLFLGSSIGNMTDETAADFIYNLGANLSVGDKLLLGVDLIKAKEIVLPAYDDAQGVTAAFNLNLLVRINNELGGDFVVENFNHKPEYSEEEGIAKSFIVSNSNQKVKIKALNKTYEFAKNEKIHTEISRKYNDEIIKKIIAKTDFSITRKITDSKNYFANYILERK